MLDRGLSCQNTVSGVIPSRIGVKEGSSRVRDALQAANKIPIEDARV
jgi:hypothetical protein